MVLLLAIAIYMYFCTFWLYFLTTLITYVHQMPFMFETFQPSSLKPLYWYDDPLFKGLAVGGTWGLYEGLRNPDGKTLKLRVNRYVFNPIHDWSYLYQFFIILTIACVAGAWK